MFQSHKQIHWSLGESEPFFSASGRLNPSIPTATSGLTVSVQQWTEHSWVTSTMDFCWWDFVVQKIRCTIFWLLINGGFDGSLWFTVFQIHHLCCFFTAKYHWVILNILHFSGDMSPYWPQDRWLALGRTRETESSNGERLVAVWSTVLSSTEYLPFTPKSYGAWLRNPNHQLKKVVNLPSFREVNPLIERVFKHPFGAAGFRSHP